VRHTNYDAIAATYDRRYIEEDYGDIERALVAFIGNSGRRVLEVGCGTGHWLQRLQLPNMAVEIDLSSAMLSRARAKVASGRLIQGRAEHLPFVDSSFDRLFCINAHHHFADKRHFLKEARRVLGTGGSVMAIALDPHNGADQWWVYDYFDGTLDIDKARYPSCEQLRTWMNETGFADTYTREVLHLPGDMSASDALGKRIITPDYTSQLAVLTRPEYDAGIARIRAALGRNDALRLSSDLRIYATYGTAA
jgi:ubiquinone/menaquinone biosynthesis C-methylase UbiE